MGNFKDALNTSLGGGLGGLVTTGLGLLMEGHNDRRQQRQQQALTDIQVNANKELSDYNYNQQLRMWNATNYSAQMEQLKKAGLNPGLVYGMGGGGSATVGGGAQSASGGQAAAQSGEMLSLGKIGIEAGLAKAQMKVLESQANLNNVEANKKQGIDTQLAQTTIENLIATTTNTEAKTALTKVQTAIEEIKQNTEADIYDKGYNVTQRASELEKINQEIIQIENSNWTFNQTKQEVVQQIKVNLINSIIEGNLKKSNIQLNTAEINKMAQDIILKGRELDIRQFTEEFKANHPDISENIGSLFNSVKEAMDKLAQLPESYTKPNRIQ